MDSAGYAPVADAIRERLRPGGGPPVLVAVGGSVCVGKSTTCERIRRLLHPVTGKKLSESIASFVIQ